MFTIDCVRDDLTLVDEHNKLLKLTKLNQTYKWWGCSARPQSLPRIESACTYSSSFSPARQLSQLSPLGMVRLLLNLWPNTYGPIGPGVKKHSFYVLLFLERQSWCGLGNTDIIMLSSGTFSKWTLELSLRRKNYKQNIFMDFFDRFFGIFFHQIGKHPNSVITYLP